jgi:hypothetical protein
MKVGANVNIFVPKDNKAPMKIPALCSIVTMLLLSCAACTAQEPDGVITFTNSTDKQVHELQINVVRNYGRGEFQSEIRDSYDQLFRVTGISPNESRDLRYTSAAEYNIDVRVTWDDHTTERYNMGYVQDLGQPHHTIVASEDGLRIDGKLPAPIQSSPEENYGKYRPAR